MDEQPNENRPNIPTWVWILTIFAVILGLQLWLSGRFSGPEQISLQEVADFIRADEVEQLVVSGDRLQITLDDGRTFGAVSYTHLDVYKRQRQAWAAPSGSPRACARSPARPRRQASR